MAIGFDANQYSRQYIAEMQAGLNDLAANGADVSDIDDLLTYTATKYWYEFNQSNEVIDGLLHTVGGQKWVGSGVVTSDSTLLTSQSTAHLQFPIVPKNMGVDLPNATHSSFDIGLGLSHANEAFQLVGFNASALESAILEDVVDSESVSTIRGLQNAYESTAGDWIWVYESVWESNQRNIYRRGPIGINSSKPTPFYSATGGTVITTAQIISDLTTGGADHSIANADAIAAILENREGAYAGADSHAPIRILVPRTKSSVGSWNGSVYVAEYQTQNGLRGSYIIDNGVPSNGGISGNSILPQNQFTPVGRSENLTTFGDPVNVANGNLVRDEIDFHFANPILPLDFKRHYDSQNTVDVGFGVGWGHSFTGILYQETDQIGSSTKRYWIDQNGQRHTFENDSYALPHTLSGKVTAFGGVLSKF